MPERPAAPFLWLAGIAVLALIATDAFVTSSMLRRITATTTLDPAQQAAPTAPGSRERSIMLLPGALDAKWYLIHTEEVLRGDAWRVRHTGLDNTPMGREVHWASLIPWSLGLGALLAGGLSGVPAAESVQTAALWFGPVSLVLTLGLIGWLVWRRFGAGTAALAILLCAATASFSGMFQSGQVDHHGIAAALCLAGVFCLGAGSAGLSAQSSAWWPAASGVFGGLAMWTSTSTALPVIAACGPAWILALLAARPSRSLCFRPADPWRWSVAGATTSLACYVLEYFPFLMGWRLEVNHPLYATAWLGAGWILSHALRLLALRRGIGIADPAAPPGGPAAAITAMMALAAPVLLLVFLRDRVFVVSDPFLFALHEHYIREFIPLWRTFGEPGAAAKLIDLSWWPLLFVILTTLLLRRRKTLPGWVPPVLILALVPALVAQVEAVMQVRWTGLATALWIAGVILAAGLATELSSQLAWGRWTRIALGLWVALGLLPATIATVRGAMAIGGDEAGLFPKAMVPPLILRDVAHRLLRADAVPRVLSDPTSSSELAFYGGLSVLGTLYWENTEGLRRAARIFSAASESEARALLTETGITHIVLPTWDTFADMNAYARLLAADGAPRYAAAPYLARVLSGDEQPDWVRPIHYPIPDIFGIRECRMDIVAIVPGQTPFEARRARGLYEFERGNHTAAIRCFEEALRLRPGDSELTGWVNALRGRLKPQSAPHPPGL